jgi:sugar lactone lactonase YvrE
MSEPKVLLAGLGIPESPRWHEGRLWFCNWIERQVMAVDLDGKAEVMATRDPGSHPMGYSIDWLPDGRLLTTGDKLRRQEPDGSMTVLAEQHANEIAVDGHGRIYLNGADFNFTAGAPPEPGYIKLVTPDGQLRQVAGDIQFPNGMVITPDNRTLIISESFAGRLTAFDIDADGGLSRRRVFAEGLGPDGICLDAEGAVWVSAGGSSVVRVAPGGDVRQRVELGENRAPFALMLGGQDRRTLFIMTAEWRTADGVTENLGRLTNGPRTGKILTLPVSVPGTGRP